MSFTIPVTVSGGRYEVILGPGLLPSAGTALAQLNLGKKTAVIADQTVSTLYGAPLLESLREAGFEPSLYEVPPGEKSKDLDVLATILSFLAQQKLDRQATIIALGGGVIGDLAGFAAASYLRGVNLVQIPTTLLAMVDSSVGGKTGVNLPEGKNLVGAFYQPKLVLADLLSLNTLPQRELAAGMAEVIKYGIIDDPVLFNNVAGGQPADLAHTIKRCVEIKADIVAADERETSGKRALLNFGHTIGHAIEAAAGYGHFLHGEAVAIGMRAAAHLSQIVLDMPGTDVRRIEAALLANGLPAHFDGDRNKLLDAMGRDKKVKAGSINWVLSPHIGESIVTSDVPAEAVDRVLEIIRKPPTNPDTSL